MAHYGSAAAAAAAITAATATGTNNEVIHFVVKGGSHVASEVDVVTECGDGSTQQKRTACACEGTRAKCTVCVIAQSTSTDGGTTAISAR
ncbi:hypothetical protein LTEGF4_12520 [Limnohabitans sp. TEGF004]|nr:hypothetical protein LTEGF4_12520 [Limnohabitans sp. TEGF004]